MTKFVTSLLVFLVSTVMFGQSVFDKFDGQEEVSTIIVNKKMFEMMGKVKMDSNDKEAQQYLNLIKKLDNLKVFVTSNSKITSEMRAAADKYLKTASLEELMRVSDGGKNVQIYMRAGAKESEVRELFMFMEGGPKDKETVLLSLTGNFNLDEISALTEKMNLPGGDDLKKAAKKGKK
jgi:hypothetical protein